MGKKHRQPLLFPSTPAGPYGVEPTIRAGNSDPTTSHEAAAKYAKSGRLKRHQAIMLAMVTARPNLTGYELFAGAIAADRAELGDVFEAYRTLADLKNAGLIRQGEPKPCSIRKSRMVTSRLTDH